MIKCINILHKIFPIQAVNNLSQYDKAVQIVRGHVEELIQLRNDTKIANPIINQYIKIESIIDSFVKLFNDDPDFDAEKFRQDCCGPDY